MLFQQCHLDGKGQKEGEIKQGWWAPQTPQVGDSIQQRCPPQLGVERRLSEKQDLTPHLMGSRLD